MKPGLLLVLATSTSVFAQDLSRFPTPTDFCTMAEEIEGHYRVVTVPQRDARRELQLLESLRGIDGSPSVLVDLRKGEIDLRFPLTPRSESDVRLQRALQLIRTVSVVERYANHTIWSFPPHEDVKTPHPPMPFVLGLAEPHGRNDWHRRGIGLDAAQARVAAASAFDSRLPSPSRPVVIAVIDSGIAMRNVEFDGRIWFNEGERAARVPDDDDNDVDDDLHGASYIGALATNDIEDQHNHGTMVASIIAGAPRRDRAGGIASHVELMPVRVLDAKNRGTSANVARGIEYAVSKNADIINLSLQSRCTSPEVSTALSKALERDIPVVAASGNWEPGLNLGDTPVYPASFLHANIIVVSALNEEGVRNYQANFGERTVDLMAPGEAVPVSLRGDGAGTSSGTSFAAPMVSGTLALLAELTQGWTWPQRVSHLIDTAVAITDNDTDGNKFATRYLSADRATQAPVTFTHPIAGETWRAGSEQTLQWSRWSNRSACTELDLSLSWDGGETFDVALKSSVPVGAGEVLVRLPSIVPPNAMPGAVVARATCTNAALSALSRNFTIE